MFPTRPAAGIACGLGAAAIWGGGAVVSRYLVTAGFDPVDLTLLRYVGCVPLAAFLMISGGDRFRLTVSRRRLVLLLLLAGPLYQALVVTGYRYAPAGTGALLLSGLLPIFALILASAATRAAPSLQSIFGTISIVTGLTLFGGLGFGSVSPAGLAIFSFAALAWAFSNHVVRVWRINPAQLTVALAFWSVLFLPFYLMSGSFKGLADLQAAHALQIVYHGWLVAFLATGLFFTAVRWAGAQLAAVTQALSPAFSAILGAALLGESLMAAHIGGLILTIAGVLATVWAIERQNRERAERAAGLRSDQAGFAEASR